MSQKIVATCLWFLAMSFSDFKILPKSPILGVYSIFQYQNLHNFTFYSQNDQKSSPSGYMAILNTSVLIKLAEVDFWPSKNTKNINYILFTILK